MTDRKQVWSCGGGTQSCAIAALIVRGDLPKPDFSVIADTGFERSTTWKYMEEVLCPELGKVGVELVRVKKSEYGQPSSQGAFATSGDLLIPAFTDEGGQKGKLSAFCSSKWKITTVNNWLSKVHGLTRSKCVKWIGFSFDEARRVNRMRQGREYVEGLIRFPLIDDVLLNRAQAIALVEEMGWPTPPRSNCWMCPNQGDHEWGDLKKNHPAEFQMAVEFERERFKKETPTLFCTSLSNHSIK